MTEDQFSSLTDEQIAELSPEQMQEVVAYWRRKCLLGEADIEMSKRIVRYLRGNRTAALAGQAAGAKKRATAGKADGKPRTAKAQAKLIDSDALLAELDGF